MTIYHADVSKANLHPIIIIYVISKLSLLFVYTHNMKILVKCFKAKKHITVKNLISDPHGIRPLSEPNNLDNQRVK